MSSLISLGSRRCDYQESNLHSRLDNRNTVVTRIDQVILLVLVESALFDGTCKPFCRQTTCPYHAIIRLEALIAGHCATPLPALVEVKALKFMLQNFVFMPHPAHLQLCKCPISRISHTQLVKKISFPSIVKQHGYSLHLRIQYDELNKVLQNCNSRSMIHDHQ